jgi:hypothetical protein
VWIRLLDNVLRITAVGHSVMAIERQGAQMKAIVLRTQPIELCGTQFGVCTKPRVYYQQVLLRIFHLVLFSPPDASADNGGALFRELSQIIEDRVRRPSCPSLDESGTSTQTTRRWHEILDRACVFNTNECSRSSIVDRFRAGADKVLVQVLSFLHSVYTLQLVTSRMSKFTEALDPGHHGPFAARPLAKQLELAEEALDLARDLFRNTMGWNLVLVRRPNARYFVEPTATAPPPPKKPPALREGVFCMAPSAIGLVGKEKNKRGPCELFEFAMARTLRVLDDPKSRAAIDPKRLQWMRDLKDKVTQCEQNEFRYQWTALTRWPAAASAGDRAYADLTA